MQDTGTQVDELTLDEEREPVPQVSDVEPDKRRILTQPSDPTIKDLWDRWKDAMRSKLPPSTHFMYAALSSRGATCSFSKYLKPATSHARIHESSSGDNKHEHNARNHTHDSGGDHSRARMKGDCRF